MTNTSVASSAIAVPVPMIHGKPAVELQDTIFTIGEETGAAEALMAKGKQALDVLDSNLNDIIKGLSYSEFMLVRDFHKAGNIDKGRSDDAAQKIWERQINRCVSTFDFVKPKSESKDAVRKAEAEAKRRAEFEKLSDAELENKVDALIAEGTTKSRKEAVKVSAELDKRNKPVLDAEQVARKATVDKIVERVRELAKAKTADADAILTQVALLLG